MTACYLRHVSLLRSVQVVFRHGARTPIWVMPSVEEANYDKKIFKSKLSHCDYDYEVLHLSGAKAEGFDGSIVNKR